METTQPESARKRTRYEHCERHAPWFAGLGRYRIVECMVEGGPGGWTPGCEGGRCRLFPGLDLICRTTCERIGFGELELDWTTPEPEPEPEPTTPQHEPTDARADFVRLGYDGAGSMHFRIGLGSDFGRASEIISAAPEGYNGYDRARVLSELEKVWPDVDSVEFGREYSPVIYATVPFWPHQANGGEYDDTGEPFADAFRRLTACRFLDAMKEAGADELSWRGAPDASGNVPSGWYSGPESIPEDVRVYSLRAWWD